MFFSPLRLRPMGTTLISTAWRRTLSQSTMMRTTPSPAMRQATTEASQQVSGSAGSTHWQYERLVSIAMLPLCVGPIFYGPSKVADFFLAFLLPLHCHMGFEQIVVDYLNKRKIGGLNKVVMAALYGTTALTIFGLYRFNTSDVGITEFVRNVWKGKQASAPKE